MLRSEIEYMSRQYKGYKEAQEECEGSGQHEMAGVWLSRAQMVRDIMRDLGHKWEKQEFVPREEKPQVQVEDPNKTENEGPSDVIITENRVLLVYDNSILMQTATGTIIEERKKAPQVQIEEQKKARDEWYRTMLKRTVADIHRLAGDPKPKSE